MLAMTNCGWWITDGFNCMCVFCSYRCFLKLPTRNIQWFCFLKKPSFILYKLPEHTLCSRHNCAGRNYFHQAHRPLGRADGMGRIHINLLSIRSPEEANLPAWYRPKAERKKTGCLLPADQSLCPGPGEGLAGSRGAAQLQKLSLCCSGPSESTESGPAFPAPPAGRGGLPPVWREKPLVLFATLCLFARTADLWVPDSLQCQEGYPSGDDFREKEVLSQITDLSASHPKNTVERCRCILVIWLNYKSLNKRYSPLWPDRWPDIAIESGC